MHFVAHFCTRLIQRPRRVFKVKLAYGERSCGVGKICKASKAKVAKLRPINPPLWPRTLNSRTEIESEKIPGTAELLLSLFWFWNYRCQICILSSFFGGFCNVLCTFALLSLELSFWLSVLLLSANAKTTKHKGKNFTEFFYHFYEKKNEVLTIEWFLIHSIFLTACKALYKSHGVTSSTSFKRR